MELYGMLLSIPLGCGVSVGYSLFLLFVVRRFARLSQLLWWVSMGVLACFGLELALVATPGAVGSRSILGPGFSVAHSVLFFIGTPALANVLLLRQRRHLVAWTCVAVCSCTVFAFGTVVLQYAVSEALYGINGNDGPFSAAARDNPATGSAARESVCYGTASHGRLERGVQIPESGPNFSPYSSLGVTLGRTYVHSKVAATIVAAYNDLAAAHPEKRYVYGESGWPEGGRIKPHRTHQNGVAVDFMVPVLDSTGRSVPLPTGATNKFGYGIEFNEKTEYDGLAIDFEAIAEHLYALDQAAKANGIGIERVIFENAYIPRLHETKRGDFVKSTIPFMQGEPWIRHDEHYHVDFAVTCRNETRR